MIKVNEYISFLFYRVAQAYVNQKKLDTETRILHTNAATFSKQTLQWLKLVEDFNTALKVDFKHVKINISKCQN